MNVSKRDVDAQLEILNGSTKKKYAIGRNNPGDGWTRNDLYTGEPKEIGDTGKFYLSHNRRMGGYMLTTRELYFALRVANDILVNEARKDV